MPSSGMLRRVVLVRTGVSEERSASIIRVTRVGELGTTLPVISNRRSMKHRILQEPHGGTSRWRHSSLSFQSVQSANTMLYSCLAYYRTLKMEAVCCCWIRRLCAPKYPKYHTLPVRVRCALTHPDVLSFFFLDLFQTANGFLPGGSIITTIQHTNT
jgi:hypothetical protein